MSRYTRTQAARDAARNLVDDHANKAWLSLAILLIATGINAAVHVSWFVSLLIAAAAVGCMCSVLLTFGTATYALARSEPKAVAELHATIRKELPR
jgi:hypothetical protein